jgi:hypothetical protein
VDALIPSLIGSGVPVILALVYAGRRFGSLESRVDTVHHDLEELSKETNAAMGLRDRVEAMHVDLAQRLARLEGALWGPWRPGGDRPGEGAAG